MLLCGELGHTKQSHRLATKKICKVCRIELDADMFTWRPDTKCFNKGYRLSTCKMCHSQEVESRPKKSRVGETKTCSVCGEVGHTKNSHKPLQERKVCKKCGVERDIDQFKWRPKGTLPQGGYRLSCCTICYGIKAVDKYKEDSLSRRLKRLLHSAKGRAALENKEFSLTLEYMIDLFSQQNGLCYYSGRKLSTEKGRESLSIDRKDNERGYSPDNVALTLWEVNCMKRTMPEDYFISLCRDIGRDKDS